MAASSLSLRSDVSSSRGSAKSSRAGSKVHWLLNERSTSISEEDLTGERDLNYKLCMEAVKALEIDTFEHIRLYEKSTNIRIDEAISRAQKDLAEGMLAEQSQRVASLVEIRRDLGVQRDLQGQVLAAEAAMAELQGKLHAVHEQQEFQAEAARAVDAALADLRSELQAGREKQELQAETTQMALADFKHDLSTLKLAQVHGLQDKALQISSDVSRSIQDMHAASAAGQSALRADLQQMVNSVRGELEEVAHTFVSHLGRTEALEAMTQALEVRNQGLTEQIAETERLLVTRVKEELGNLAAVSDSASQTAGAAGTPGPVGEPTGAFPLGALPTGHPQPPTGGQGPGSPEERAALLARVEAVEALCQGLARKAGGAEEARRSEADTAVRDDSIAELQVAVGTASGSIERLALDLNKERTERLQSLAHLGRLTAELRLNSVQAGTNALQSRMEFERTNADVGVRIGQLEAALLNPRLDKLEERLRSVELTLTVPVCETPETSAQAVRTINVIDQEIRQLVARGRGKVDSGDDGDCISEARSMSACPPPPGPGATAQGPNSPRCLHAAEVGLSASKLALKDFMAEPSGVSTYAASGLTEEPDEASIKAYSPEPPRPEFLATQQNAGGLRASGSASPVLSSQMSPRKLRNPGAESRSPSRMATVLSVTSVMPWSTRGPSSQPETTARPSLGQRSTRPASGAASPPARSKPRLQTQSQSSSVAPCAERTSRTSASISLGRCPVDQVVQSQDALMTPTTQRIRERSAGTAQPKLPLGAVHGLGTTWKSVTPTALWNPSLHTLRHQPVKDGAR